MARYARAVKIYPFIRYDDPRRAIGWLCEAFGFERKAVHEGEDGTLEHVELQLGDAIVMPGGESLDRFGMGSPVKLGATTAGMYVVVEDVDALHERAKAAGAEIVMEPTDQDYGSRDFVARDLEGHVWSFGTYDPAAQA